MIDYILIALAFAGLVVYGLSQVHKRPVAMVGALVLALLLCGLIDVAR